MRRSVGALTVLGIGLLTSCGGGEVTDGAGPGTKPDTTTVPPVGPPTVQRASITAQVRVDAADASVAASAGLTPTGVTVRLTRTGSSDAPRSAVASADGLVTFDGLLEGLYQLTVERRLTDAEVARLPAGERDASLFAAGTQLALVPPMNKTAELSLVATRRGSIVISELFPFNAIAGQNLGYGLGTYLEVYNNSDTTAYLDGMLVGRTPLTLHYGFAQYPCDQVNAAARNDSAGIAVLLIQSFPGAGRNYPIRPGEAKVIAVDAIDHRAASPLTDQVDLSRADFEQRGTDADVDNPFVPDMVNVMSGGGALGRGYPNGNAPQAYVLALPTSLSTLRMARLVSTTGASGGGETFDAAIIPKTRVLDVMSVDALPSEIARSAQGGTVRCTPWIAPAFDRAQANLMDVRLRQAISRKSLGRTADGRDILQRTRTSARDFEYAEPLRRSLLK